MMHAWLVSIYRLHEARVVVYLDSIRICPAATVATVAYGDREEILLFWISNGNC